MAINGFIYGIGSVTLILDLAILGIVIAILVRQGFGKGGKDGKGKKKADVFLTRGSQFMNVAAAGQGFNSTHAPGGLTQNNALGVGTNLNVDNTLIQGTTGDRQRTYGIPGVHDFVLYSDPRTPEILLSDGYALGMEMALSPGLPCTPATPAALDWIYIASTSNLSHVKIRLTIRQSKVTSAGVPITTCLCACLPKLCGAHWYNMYGYERNVTNFHRTGKGCYEFEVPLVVASQAFPLSEITFRYAPQGSLTPGATYLYKVEVVSARCASLLNRKCDSTYYAIQDVPLLSPATFASLGGINCTCCQCGRPCGSCGCNTCNSCGQFANNCNC